MELRAEINRLASNHDLAAAARQYRALVKEFPQSVLNDTRQLEIANQLCAEQDYASAAAAYELLLERYPNTPKAIEVHLILAVTCARQLNEPERARRLLDAIWPRLYESQQKSLAESIRAELPAPAAPRTSAPTSSPSSSPSAATA
jgi:TolA-binding protein